MSKWILTPKPSINASVRLFCFPYAGVGASAYYSWKDHLPSEVELNLIQLPGRENRLRESLPESLDQLVAEIGNAISPYLDRPFVFFGHSLGAVTSFETTRWLRRTTNLQPLHLVVSAFRAPHLPDPHSPIHGLPDEQFIEALKDRYDGLPAVIMQDKELLDLFVPILRGDLQLSETYVYTADAPLSIPITACGGRDDIIFPVDSIESWQQHTENGFRLRMFQGGHFYLKEMQSEVIRMILMLINPFIGE